MVLIFFFRLDSLCHLIGFQAFIYLLVKLNSSVGMSVCLHPCICALSMCLSVSEMSDNLTTAVVN